MNFIIVHRLIEAISTLPNVQSWLYAAVLSLVYLIIALPIGFQHGFLRFEVLRVSWKTIIGVLAIAWVTPAFTEELFFRVLLLPRTTEQVSESELWFWGFVSLALFIVYHPLNALTLFPQGLETFFNWIFLLLAALLGILCSLTYFYSGSLWIPVLTYSPA
ncbi:MAG TPA: CPBP family glutamic-type intramembrane protease [Coleofasciculaceae cyanobacterium]